MNFLYPVPPSSVVTQTFQEHVERARQFGWTNYNGGIDWGIPTGTPVKAAQKGQVTVVRTDATGYGVHVRIQHDADYLTIYGHLASFSVQAGSQLEAGQVIGLSDNTGNSTGPHLHFELRHRNLAIDPAPLLATTLEPTEPTEPTEPEKPEPEEFPELPRVKVTAIALNIRRGPGVSSPAVGLLQSGVQAAVMQSIHQGDDVWLQIGYNQYIAMQVGGQKFVVWV